jgi:amino acid adenylation domain-containing protein
MIVSLDYQSQAIILWRHVLIHSAFLERVTECPDAPAIFYKDDTVTYDELAARAGQFAAALKGMIVRPDDRVLVALAQGPDQIAAVIGVLLAGAVYVPVDPCQPDLRLAKIAQQCDPAAVIVADTGASSWAPDVARVTPGSLPAPGPVKAAPRKDDDLAYIVFTSGTTGIPKGVAISHGAAWNTIEDINHRWAVKAFDRALALSALTFDLSVYDIFGLLAVGGALVVPEPHLAREPAEWLRLVRNHHVSLWNSVPALMGMMVEFVGRTSDRVAGTDLRLVMLSGDWIPLSLPDRVKTAFAPDHVVSLGGATEVSIWSIFYEIGEVSPGWTNIPYGRALTDQTVHILDQDTQPCADGDVGEICFGGRGLAREYWGDAEKTRASFVSSERFGRLYRTGDNGRVLPNGEIEFLGRRDTQVKIGGYRIELSDVEAALLEHDDVSEAVARLVASDANAEDCSLAAFVVARTGDIDLDALRKFLQARLPEYMLPAHIETRNALPLTANAKVDRGALRIGENHAPQRDVSDPLMSLVASVLKQPGLSEDSNFFDHGAQSLVLAQMVARLREEFGVELSLREIFENPSVAQLRPLIADGARCNAAFRRVSDHPLSERASYNQEQVCFLTSFFRSSRAYNFQATLEFVGDLDIPRLERAISEVIARHEMLRTTIHLTDEGYCSEIHPPFDFEIPCHNLSGLPRQEQDAIFQQMLEETLDTVFDVEVLPMLKVMAVKRSDTEWSLIQIEHHVVHDGWSIGRLWYEIQEIYLADLEGRKADLPELTAQYQNFVAWQRDRVGGDFGKTALKNIAKSLEGAALDVRMSDRQIENAELGGHNIRQILPEDWVSLVRKRARELRVSDYAVLLAVFASFIGDHAGQEDFCVGAAASARTEREIEPLIGMIVNTIPVRANLKGVNSLAEMVPRIHAAQMDAMRYQDVPLAMIVKELRVEKTQGRNPMFQYVFGFHDSAVPDFDFGTAQGRLHEEQNQTAKFDINVIVIPPGTTRPEKHARILWEFSSRLFTEDDAKRLSNDYVQRLKAALQAPRSTFRHGARALENLEELRMCRGAGTCP